MIFDKILSRDTVASDPSAARSRSQFWGMPTAGVRVDDITAFKLGAFFACIRVISEDVMPLPWPVIRRDGNQRTPVPDHPVEMLLNRAPNPEMPACFWRQAITAHALAVGNGYAEIERTKRGEPAALWLLDPTKVRAERTTSGDLYYEVENDRGSNTNLAPQDIFHLRGPSYDGITGQNISELAREAISLGLAAQMFGAAYFGNGAIPAGLLRHKPDGKMKPLDAEGVENLYESWESRLKGAGKRKVMYVEPDLEYEPLGGKPDESQLNETQRAIVNEICRWFRVPPHKVMDLSRATFSNIEHQNRDYVDGALIPWAKRLESEADFKLLPEDHYSKLNMRALLRGDSAARAEYYQKMQIHGNLTINDVLGLEDLPGIGDEGDVRMVPMNMTRLDQLGEQKDAGNLGDRGK